MQLGKYKPRSYNKGFGRRKKTSFKLYYGLTLVFSGLLLLVIGFLFKLL